MPRKIDIALVRTIGIDTGKNALHLVGRDERGAIVLREKVSRHQLVDAIRSVCDQAAGGDNLMVGPPSLLTTADEGIE